MPVTFDDSQNPGLKSNAHVVVTGATGYIGHRFVEHALERGLRVTVLGRRELGALEKNVRFISWSLGSPVPAETFTLDDKPAMALVHLAHQWTSEREEPEDENLGAAATILCAARAAGVNNIVVASTISARQQALNRYGRVKWKIENLLQGDTEKAARIGLVYGGPRRSQWGQLCKITSLSPILPMIAPQTLVQPIHLDELVEGLIRLAAGMGPKNQVVGLASNDAVPFGYFLKKLRKVRQQQSLVILPIPVPAALFLVAIVNIIPLLPTVSREKVLGLAGMPVLDTNDDLQALKLCPAAISTGLLKGSRRAVIREGHALLRFVLKHPPAINEMKRYVRGVERHGVYQPLDLPPLWRLITVSPVKDRLAISGPGLQDRLYLAALIAECARDNRAAFYRYSGMGCLRVIGTLFGLAVRETMLAPVRAVLILLARR
jgi:nucleoside-diphosphate-sugar epimerase